MMIIAMTYHCQSSDATFDFTKPQALHYDAVAFAFAAAVMRLSLWGQVEKFTGRLACETASQRVTSDKPAVLHS